MPLKDPVARAAAVAKYYQDHKEEARARKQKWQEENREKQREANRKSYEKYREARIARATTYHREHPEIGRVATQNWGKRHPEALKLSSVVTRAKRAARQKALPDHWLPEHLLFARTYFHECCAVCERPLDGLFYTAAADHWIPLSSPECPGTIPGNMVPLCHGEQGCNSFKARKMPEDWLRERYGVRKAKKILKRILTYFDIVRVKFPLPEDTDEPTANEVPPQIAV